MAKQLGSNSLFRGAGRQRYLLIIVTLLLVFVLLALLAARVHPILGENYVSVINHGHFQICRVTAESVVICPPLSTSPSKSYSPSKSVSAATSLKPPSLSKSVSTSTSLSVQAQ